MVGSATQAYSGRGSAELTDLAKSSLVPRLVSLLPHEALFNMKISQSDRL